MIKASFFICLALALSFLLFGATTCSGQDLNRILDNARVLMGAGDYETAIELLTHAADSDPATAPQVLDVMASFHRDEKQFDKAIDCYKRIISEFSSSDHADAYYQLGMTYENADKTDNAIATYDTFLKEYPNHPIRPDVILRIAEQYHVKGQCDQALQMYADIVKDYPDRSTKAFFLIGMCNKGRGRYSDAVDAFKKGVAEVPPSVAKDDIWLEGMKYQIIECYQLSCEWDSGLNVIQDLAQRFPDDAMIYEMGVGDCYVGLYDYDKAVVVYTELVDRYQKDPRTADVLFKLADLLEKQEKLDERLKCLERFSNDYPTHWRIGDVYLKQAETLKMQGKYDEAVAEFQKLSEARIADYTKARFSIGLLYRDRKMYDKAISEYRKGIAEAPSSIPADDMWLKAMKVQIAECYTDQKDYKSAQAQYKILAAEYPDDPGLALQATTCVSGETQLKEARKELDDILKTITDSKDLHATYFQIAERLWRNGQTEEALTLLDDIAEAKPSFKGYALIVKAELLTYNLGRHSESINIARQLLSDGTPDPMGTHVVLINALQNNGQTLDAIIAIEDLLKSDLSPKERATWTLRIGEIQMAEHNYEAAAITFRRTCKIKNAQSITSAMAMHSLAICYHQLGYDRIARQCLQRVVRLYPDTNWAKESKNTLKGWDFLEANPSLRKGG
jgi:tetratricopeptide (TPR) repeat protein